MKAIVAPGPPSFTSFSISAPLRGSFRRWRKLLAVGVSTLDALDLGKGVAQRGRFLFQSPATDSTFSPVLSFSRKAWEEEAGAGRD